MAFFGTLIEDSGTIAGNQWCMLPGVGKGPQARDSIIFDHEGAPCTDSKYHRRWRRWRGVLSNASQCFGRDGRCKRYKVRGRTKQDVIEVLKKKATRAEHVSVQQRRDG